MSKDENNKQNETKMKIVSRAAKTNYNHEIADNSTQPTEPQPEYGKYIYADIIRDFPEMADYLGRLKLVNTFTCIDLLGLAYSLRIRINYSSDLDTDFALYQPKVTAINGHSIEVVLIVSDHQKTYQDEAWSVAQGMATHILNLAEYVPDFSAANNGMHKWTVSKLASALLLPDDLVVRVVELSVELNTKLLDQVDTLNHGMIFNTPRASIIAHTAAQLANVPEWLMSQRIADVYHG